MSSDPWELRSRVPVLGTMTDSTGDEVRFGVHGGAVIIGCSNSPVILGEDAKQEEFAQWLVAMCHQAKANRAEAGEVG